MDITIAQNEAKENINSDIDFVEKLKDGLIKSIELHKVILNSYYNCHLPELYFDFTLKGKTAGQLCAKASGFSTEYKIRLNLDFAKQHPEAFIQDVIPHELAHFYILWKYGIQRKTRKNRIRPHGPEWQSVMLDCFQRPADIYHSFDISTHNSARLMTTFPYECSCRIHQLSAIRHNKVQKGKMKYLCQLCKNNLKPIV